jgi:hypothetical protein
LLAFLGKQGIDPLCCDPRQLLLAAISKVAAPLINEVLYFLAGGSWTNVFTEVLQRVQYVFVILDGIYCFD